MWAQVRLVDWIRERMGPELPPFGGSPQGRPPRWSDRRVVVFTENREGTKRYLRSILEQATVGTDRADVRIEVIDGLTQAPAARRSSAGSTPTPPSTRYASCSPPTRPARG